MNDYNNEAFDDEPEEADGVDDAAEPDADDTGETAEVRVAEQKVTTKFLTKYERGKQPHSLTFTRHLALSR